MKTQKKIPLSVPNITGNELKYIQEAISESWVSTAGPTINSFENKIAEYVGSEGAVAVQSGTAGLHLSLLALGLNADEIVLVPSLTFIASINPIKYVGAEPVFLDVDESLCIDNNSLKKFISSLCEWDGKTLRFSASNQKVSGIVYVHIFGNTGAFLETMIIARQYNLFLLEDATEALGSKYIRGEKKGSFLGTLGDIGVFSFNGNKIITTGGGGMVVSGNKDHLDKIRYLSSQAKDNPFIFQHNNIGFNYRMTNLQAAMGLAQLERLEEFISIKRQNYELYKLLFNDSEEMKILEFNEDLRPNYWFYSLHTNKSDINDLVSLVYRLEEKNISVRPIWQLNHTQKPYKECFSMPMSISSYYYNRVLNLPCSSNLTQEDIKYVYETLLECNHG